MGYLRRFVAASAFPLALAGCALGPDFVRPAIEVPASWQDREPPADAATLANLPWWDLFEDEELRTMVATSLEANKDLHLAVARVDQARARFGITRSAQFPELDARAGYLRQRLSEKGTFPIEDPENDLFTGSIAAAFELDVWGRLRRASEAARAELLASEANRHAVVTTLVSDVAAAYLALRELDLELAITRRTVDARGQSLDLVRERYESGLTSALDLRQAESDRAATGALIPDLERQIAQTEHRLSILLGRNPGRIARGKPLTGQVFPPAVPPGLPSALLERRPDIRQAEEGLVAANARIGVARAALFPQISLTGFFGTESIALSDLFTGPARVWQFGPSVTVPLFKGGRNRANLELAEAERREALIRYEQAIQQAFREVEDALVAHRKAQEALTAQREAVRASREALAVAEFRYSSGLTNYLSVLDTQRTLLGAEIAESRSLLAQLGSVVQLYRALGGGWSAEQVAGSAAGVEQYADGNGWTITESTR